MAKAGSYQTEAIIIKKTKLGEADRILTFYTPDMGKVQGVAKGVRKPKSKLSGHLELLTHSMVLLTRGRGNLDTITGSQTIDGFYPLKSDLDLGACALYATELVNQFGVDRQENQPLFSLILELMRELCRIGPGSNGTGVDRSASDTLLRYFEVHLLQRVGYRPQLRECVACRQALPLTATHYFSVSAGGVVCLHCRSRLSFTYPVSPSALQAFQALQEGDWSSTGQINLDPHTRRELEMLLRNYLRYILDRDIRSVAWLDLLKHTLPGTG
jgi:DNA repair protein RecO (recombination protein O)